MKNQQKTCPYCAENIPEESLHCPYCGEKLPAEAHTNDIKTWWIVLLSVISAGLIFFILLNSDFSKSFNSDRLLEKGITLYKKGDYDESIKILEKQIEEDSNNYKAYYYLGKNYEEKADTETAIKYYKKALQINPDYDELKIPLVKLCIKDDDSGCVAEFIESAYKQNKNDTQILFYYATHIIDKTEKSIPLLKKVLEKDPNNYLANKYLGYLYSEKKDYKTAIPYLKKCVNSKTQNIQHPNLDSVYKKTPKAEYMLARAYIEEDYYTTAIELLNKVISKTNDSTAIELKEEAQERKEIYLYENKSKSQGKKTSNYSEQDSYNSETNKSYNKLKQSYSNQNMSQSDNQIDNVDFGPYMRELQRRIKQNWHPPKGQESRRVVLLFKIAKDGSLLSCKVDKTSGIPNVDQAAIDAVKLTSPFKSLPANYKGSSVDIQFSFDYNVFNSNNQKI